MISSPQDSGLPHRHTPDYSDHRSSSDSFLSLPELPTNSPTENTPPASRRSSTPIRGQLRLRADRGLAAWPMRLGALLNRALASAVRLARGHQLRVDAWSPSPGA